MKLFSQQHSAEFILEDNPFAAGAEGSLHNVVGTGKEKLVAKLYFPHKLSKERQLKLEYLYKNQPAALSNKGHNSLVWPIDLLYDIQNGELRGFVMRYAAGEKLELLCSSTIPAKHYQNWGRFAFSEENALNLRMRLCFNLATAVYTLHNSGQYVLVDLKPDNVIVSPDGLLSLVDIDSMEVVSGEKTLFDAPVTTPEYTPPEFYRKTAAQHDPTMKQEWDYFSLAVIFYKLLLGVHPFAGSNRAPYEDCVSLEQKIEKGLFAMAEGAAAYMQVIPPPQQGFYRLSPKIQALFLRCFVAGHQQPEARPNAEEWCIAFLDAIEDNALWERFSMLHFDYKQDISRPSASAVYGYLEADLHSYPIELEKLFNYKPPMLPLAEKALSAEPELSFEYQVGCTFAMIIATIVVLWTITSFDQASSTAFILAIPAIWIAGSFISDLYKQGLRNNSPNLDRQKHINNLLESYEDKVAFLNQMRKNWRDDNFEQYFKKWKGNLSNMKRKLKTGLTAIDKKIEQLIIEEQKEYQQAEASFMHQLRETPLLQAFKVENMEALKKQIALLDKKDAANKEILEAIQILNTNYRKAQQQLSKNYNRKYQELLDEAFLLHKQLKEEYLNEFEKRKEIIRIKLSGETSTRILIKIPEELARIKLELEKVLAERPE